LPPLERVGLELPLQPLMRQIGLGDHEEPRGVLVDPVHDPRPDPPADPRQPAAGVVQERVDQRAVRRPRRRVHDEPGRLVDDDQVGVLVHDGQRDRLGRRRDRRRLGQRQHQLGAGRQPHPRVVQRPPAAVRQRAALDQRMQPRPAEAQPLWHRRRQRLIKPLAGRAPERDPKLARRLGHWTKISRNRRACASSGDS